MLENFEVDTNLVKLRTDRFSSTKLIAKDFVAKAGCLYIKDGIIGIAVNDADPDTAEEVVVIYRADKIVLPCQGSFSAGELIGLDAGSVGDPADACEFYMSESGFVDNDDNMIFHAIALEDCDSGSEITWVLCDLLGSPVIIAGNDEGGS